MGKRKVAVVLAIVVALSQSASNATLADGSHASIQNHWLMLVGTRNTDPTREAAFNSWYDEIDIPDVLKVPGYKRARRGLREAIPVMVTADTPDDQDRYVALYDIESTNMDKTIIDMLMASKKMEMTGRSTDLLKVVERTYFRQHLPSLEAPGAHHAGKHRYVYLERVACCRDEATENLLNDWYDNTHLPDMMTAEGLTRVTRYELYRVLMVEPKQVPHFLTVYELEADSAAQAFNSVRARTDKLRDSGRMSDLFVDDGSAIYLTIGDVRRE